VREGGGLCNGASIALATMRSLPVRQNSGRVGAVYSSMPNNRTLFCATSFPN
jgi:hypothetical protein